MVTIMVTMVYIMVTMVTIVEIQKQYDNGGDHVATSLKITIRVSVSLISLSQFATSGDILVGHVR